MRSISADATIRGFQLTISSVVSRLSALILLLGGLSMLFGPDIVLPAAIPGYPVTGAWLGQALGAGWLGMAALNWLQRNAVLGGIYGRPTVMANLTLYFISALSLLNALRSHDVPSSLWLVVVVATALAVTYGALLLRGPFDAAGRSAG